MKDKIKYKLPIFDFTSLYPTVFKDKNDYIIKMIIRKKKLNNILNNIKQ